jgi:urease subunit beta
MNSRKPQAGRPSWAPGEILYGDGDIAINPGAQRLAMEIVNTGDRPVQVGSHVHLPQANAALDFDREAAHGHRLDIPAGTAVRFEPGVAQQVQLVPLSGSREVHGLSLNPPGRLDAS